MKCGIEGCTSDHKEVYLHSRCHISSPTWVKVIEHSDSSKQLEIICAECSAKITTFRIPGAVQ